MENYLLADLVQNIVNLILSYENYTVSIIEGLI